MRERPAARPEFGGTVEPWPARSTGGTTAPASLFICFSHLRWDFVWQRPQHLLCRAARQYRVVMIEEPIHGDVPQPTLDISTRDPDIRVVVPVLPHGTDRAEAVVAQRALLERFLADEPPAPRIFWYYTPMAVAFSGHLEADLRVYDNMDELSAFRGASPEMLANEARLLVQADLVFTGGMSLFEAKRGRHPSVHPFPSSIDAGHFGAARGPNLAEPADQAGIPHPRLGFFGVVDERMDVGLVRDIAAARPDWQLVMLGPVVKIDPETLPRLPNIHWLGPRTYPELPAYLAGWDVGLMPFALNESTRFISPTKTPEYLAAGIPVVSTSIADVIRPYGQKGIVAIADGPAEVIAKVEAALGGGRDADWLAATDRHLATMSWDQTWEAMHLLMAEIMDEPDRPKDIDSAVMPEPIAAAAE